MDLSVVVQKLAFGLFVGSNYGVVAVGLTLIFGVMRVLNVGHGELLMLGGYVSYFAFTVLGVDPYLSVALSALCLFALGIALNTVLFQFVERLDEEQRIKNSLLISFGLALVLQNVALFAFSADERSVRAAYAGGAFTLGGIILPYTRLLSFVVGTVVVAILYVVLQRTYFGLAIRATAQDWQAAALAGVDVRRAYLLLSASVDGPWSRELLSLDLGSGASRRWPMASGAFALALSPVDKLYVADTMGDRLWRLDTRTDTLLMPLPLAGAPLALGSRPA